MAVSRRLRFEILRRDNHTCRYCGAQAPDVKLTVDHVLPIALGGSDEPSNLVAACDDCNGGKSSIAPDAGLVTDVEADALRWARARTTAIELWRTRRLDLAADLARFADAWDEWTYGEDQDPVPRDPAWEISVERWMRTGLEVPDLVALIPLAMHGKPRGNGSVIPIEERWRYYCGVVWRTLDDLETATHRMLAEDEPTPTAFVVDGQGMAERAPRLCIECDERLEHDSCGVCSECIQNGYGVAVAY